jgi:endonuclease G
MEPEEKRRRLTTLVKGLALPPRLEEGLDSVGSSPQMDAWVERASYATDETKAAARSALRKIARQEELNPRELDATEAIILPEGRPAIDVIGGSFAQPPDPWTHLFQPETKRLIEAAIPAIGRVEIPSHPLLPYAGTGFVVGDGLLMTNRHVAELFVLGLGFRDLRFRTGLEPVQVDFKRERNGDNSGAQPFHVHEVVMVHPHWDMALLRVEGLGAGQRTPSLETTAPEELTEQDVVVIGYPAFDPRNPKEIQDRIFDNVYQIKRMQPGKIKGVRETMSFQHPVRAFTHDSSTLGGNSGSAVISVRTGRILGLHFGGLYLDANFAVPAHELARDARVVDTGVAFAAPVATGSAAPSWLSAWSDVEAPRPPARPTASAGRPLVSPASSASTSVSFTIPVNLTVTVGAAQTIATATVAARPARTGPVADEIDAGSEVPVSSYADREGYQEAFFGAKFVVSPPEVVRDASDVLVFGADQRVLHYEHFSVQMSKRRRMCRWSACNIDGEKSKKSTRAGWRTDPRIPKQQQILNECYGSPPKFSRGHMTRREDPAWGSATAVKRGNEDSMHVTNTVPQMQSFNAPIWLGLEDYALQHARQDDMKISVFTGPYLDDEADPTLYGVQIPVAFWKIIAFIHEKTKKLCATGYEMSQQNNLPDTEFVFGNFVSPQLNLATQVPIRTIEFRSGIDFGKLASCDPMSLESVDGSAGPLHAFEEIKFV